MPVPGHLYGCPAPALVLFYSPALGDPISFIAEFRFHEQRPTERFNVPAQSINLCPLNRAVLDVGDSFLADVQDLSHRGLREFRFFTQLPETIGADFGGQLMRVVRSQAFAPVALRDS